MILSGMSNLEQMKDNVRTFESERPLSEAEEAVLLDAVAPMRSRVPCTACRYCCDGCPMELDIPMLIAAYNDLSLGFNFTPVMRLEALPEEIRKEIKRFRSMPPSNAEGTVSRTYIETLLAMPWEKAAPETADPEPFA